MTSFEWRYRMFEPFLLPLHRQVRQRLRREATSRAQPIDILDVGGRKSHYTIGVPARVPVSDLPRASAVQRQLNLGINNDIIAQTRARRSNVHHLVYDDMTESKLPDDAFDVVVAVEVIEHVEADGAFVSHVWRVLRPGGCFLLTTPNGDSVPNTNADHKRHYRREELLALLRTHFHDVEVRYAVTGGVW